MGISHKRMETTTLFFAILPTWGGVMRNEGKQSVYNSYKICSLVPTNPKKYVKS